MTCHQYSKEIQNFISARTQLERDLLDVNNFFRLEQAAESGEELQATAPDDGKWNERPTPGGKQLKGIIALDCRGFSFGRSGVDLYRLLRCYLCKCYICDCEDFL
jgi:hypothetical protein